MKRLKKAHIIEADQYSKKVTELGHLIQYHDIEVSPGIEVRAIIDSREPHHLYFMRESVEWVLSQ